MADISDILLKLLERTNLDKVDWQATADESAFMAAFGNTSVVVSKDELLGTNLEIINLEGKVIEDISSDPRAYQELSTELRELYSKARRIALGVDSQLEGLLQEIEADEYR